MPTRPPRDAPREAHRKVRLEVGRPDFLLPACRDNTTQLVEEIREVDDSGLPGRCGRIAGRRERESCPVWVEIEAAGRSRARPRKETSVRPEARLLRAKRIAIDRVRRDHDLLV